MQQPSTVTTNINNVMNTKTLKEQKDLKATFRQFK
jgi:hypothetical protein